MNDRINWHYGNGWVTIKDRKGEIHTYVRGQVLRNPPEKCLDIFGIGGVRNVYPVGGQTILEMDVLPETIIVSHPTEVPESAGHWIGDYSYHKGFYPGQKVRQESKGLKGVIVKEEGTGHQVFVDRSYQVQWDDDLLEGSVSANELKPSTD